MTLYTVYYLRASCLPMWRAKTFLDFVNQFPAKRVRKCTAKYAWSGWSINWNSCNMNWNSVDKRWPRIAPMGGLGLSTSSFIFRIFSAVKVLKPALAGRIYFFLDEPYVLKITTEKTLKRSCSTRCKRYLTPQASWRMVTKFREEYNRSVAVRVEGLCRPGFLWAW